MAQFIYVFITLFSIQVFSQNVTIQSVENNGSGPSKLQIDLNTKVNISSYEINKINLNSSSESNLRIQSQFEINENQSCNQFFETKVLNSSSQISHQLSNYSKVQTSEDTTFSKTVFATTVNSVSWFVLVQSLKASMTSDFWNHFLTKTFAVTLPLDVLISLISHKLGLTENPKLKRFLDGEFIGAQNKFIGRVLANTLVNSSVILGTWAAVGIPIDSGSISAALGLCAGVYSMLQVTKPFLFQKLPKYFAKKDSNSLTQKLPQQIQEWKESFLNSTEAQKNQHLEATFLEALSTLVYSQPFEKKDSLSLVDSRLKNKILKLNETIQNSANQKEALKAQVKIMELRKELVKKVLKEAKKDPEFFEYYMNIVRFDSSLSTEQIYTIHKDLLSIDSKSKLRTYASSFVDQAIAVGFAGGVLLYSTTYWATHRELPQFINEFFKLF